MFEKLSYVFKIKGSRNKVLLVFGIGAIFFSFSSTASASTIISSGTIISQDTIFTASNSPYVIQGAVIVNAGSTLTLEPGVIVKFSQFNYFTVNGTLNAQGTAADPVYFTSLKDDTVGGDTNGDGFASIPAKMDWNAITVNTGGTINFVHTSIRYAYTTSNNGGSITASDTLFSDIEFGIYQTNGSLALSRSHLTATGYGILLSGGSVSASETEFSSSIVGLYLAGDATAAVSQSNFHDNTGYGVTALSGSLTLTGNIFSNNALGMGSIGNGASFIHSGNSASGSGTQGWFIAYAVAQDRTWMGNDFPYIIQGSFSINPGVTLTIGQGSIVKFDRYSYLTVNGTLNAQGTASNPIYLTSLKDDVVGGDTNGDGGASVPAPGNWDSVNANAGSALNLSHTLVRYGTVIYNLGGSFSISDTFIGNNSYSDIYQTAGSLILSRSHITSAPYGVLFGGGTASITGTEFDTSSIGLYAFAEIAAVSQNSFHDNTYGLYNLSANPINAANNWWGDASGPYHPTLNPAGTGNRVSNNVNFIPWLGHDPTRNQPLAVSGIAQYKSDGVTAINEGGITTESSPNNPDNATVMFKATIINPSGGTAKLQVEIKRYSQFFDTTGITESTFIPSGSTATATRYGLVQGQYHWQARAVDDQGNASDWQEFGATGNVDFTVNLTLSAKAAELAKLVINGPYLGDGDTFGGKGWDPIQAKYVTSNVVLSGYQYWNNKLRTIAFGTGLDCSGLTQWAYNYSFDPRKSLLHNAIRYDGADGQYHYNSTSTTELELQPGDPLFFGMNNNGVITATHVAMYVGNFVSGSETFDVVEANSPARGIIVSKKDELKISQKFLALGSSGFRRVILSPSIGGQVKAGSPIDLAVTDPDGFTITATTSIQTNEEYLREVPGELYYSENELGPDGRPEDVVYWPTQKIGDYVVKAIPEAGVPLTATYNLEFQSGSTTISLAQNIPLSQAPSQGYGITTSAVGTINTFIPVAIDIKLGSYPNSINLGSNGVVPVVIFGSTTFDVRQIDPNTIKLANASVKLKGNSQPMVNYSDVNRDGFIDIVIQVSTQALELTSSDVKANLEGKLINGTLIKGSDSIRIVP